MTDLTLVPLDDATAGDREEKPGASGPPLPRAHRSRWQPLRGGIVSIWDVEDQEFRFRDGRILLRGHNGAGKSLVMSQLLPFLFDGEMEASRLSTFGVNDKGMRGRLLQDGLHKQRVGYCWLEFGRALSSGDEYVTIGIGMQAFPDRSIEPWFFVTPQRVGADIKLIENRSVVSREAFGRAIAGRAETPATAREYRTLVASHLFGGMTQERYRSMLNLLFQLRRPHLAQNLRPDTMAQVLSDCLPPLDPEVIADLAVDFESLEAERHDMESLERAHVAIRNFVDHVYRPYAQLAARERAAAVRTSDSDWKTASEKQRRLHDAYKGALEDQKAATALGRDLEVGRAQLEADRTALLESRAMQGANELRQAKEMAKQARSAADRAAEDLSATQEAESNLERRLTVEEENVAKVAARRDAEARAAERAAALAHSAPLHEAHVGRWMIEPDGTEAALEGGIRERRSEIAATQAAGQTVQNLAAVLAGIRQEMENAEESAARAAADELAAQDAVDTAVTATVDEIHRWWNELRVAALNDEAIAEVVEVVAGLQSEASPRIHDLLTSASGAQELALVIDAGRAGNNVASAESVHAGAEAEKKRIAAEADPLPPPSYTQTATRDGRPGAAFSMLYDFASAVTPDQAAGLEAALEASGLLSAWVLPDGTVLDQRGDAFLSPTEPRGGMTLGTALVPVHHGGVGVEQMDHILASIALTYDAEAGEPAAAVGFDGSWRVGGLHGRWMKDTAAYVGAGARARERERRLAAAGTRAQEALRLLEEARAGQRIAQESLERFRTEIAAFPSLDQIQRARRELAAANAAADTARRHFNGMRDQYRARDAEHSAADEEFRRLAARHRLPADMKSLGELLDTLETYAASCRKLANAVRDLRTRMQQAEDTRQRLGEAREATLRRRRYAEDTERNAVAASQRATTLERVVGKSAAEVTRQYAEVEARLGSTEGRLRDSSLRLQELTGTLAGIGTELTLHDDVIAELTDRRQRTTESLRQVGALLLPYVLESLPEKPAADWTLTDALHAARAVERSAGGTRGEHSLDEAESQVMRSFGTLQEEASRYDVSWQRSEGVIVVRGSYGGRQRLAVELEADLRGALEQNRRHFSDTTREIFRRFLHLDAGRALRSALREARAFIDDLNEQLAQRRTASGLRLQLEWGIDPDAEAGVDNAVTLLRRDPKAMGEKEEEALLRFFERRIETFNRDGQTRTWVEHLGAILDYRRWHRFRILKQMPGQAPHVLTWRDTSSGGEKAVMVHQPFLAAAAALYRSVPGAPRVILLDEAFAGIDETGRSSCLALCVHYDLDLFMTSEILHGCYPVLPGMAIYVLAHEDRGRDADGEIRYGAVSAQRWVWDGTTRRRADVDEDGGPEHG
jgi:uncharacterized protein (TIGR02680 family)